MPLRCQKCPHSNIWDIDSVTTAFTTLAPDHLEAEGHRAALAEIQAEITQFKTFSAHYVSALEKRQEEVAARLNSIVYPILSLPTEITSRIFVECLPDDGAPSYSGYAPLLLMLVCRQWKKIALSTCQLWSSLRIQSFSHDLMVLRGTLCRMQNWFSRARAFPLFLTIHYTCPGKKALDLEQLDISSILPRIWRLVLPNNGNSRYQSPIPVHTPLPQLQYLDASFTDVDIKYILENAPLLAELRWRRRSEGTLNFHGFTSQALTTLHISPSVEFSSSEFISIL
ncbi:F-box domain-containing protein [Mycena sanguinolenta]|uniref:F-box domain-containing protein n=1 Tax=Mycena sanguinolenta TaxID=230812 RepID=A0A8H6XAZ0_9AGAR|nr:F-box domain-containing protein [Mycena sanguinolenta]